MIRLNHPTFSDRLGARLLAAALLSAWAFWTVPAFSEDIEEEIDGRYTYIRALDGEAELINRDGDEETEAITNYPVLTGDRIETEDDTFVDIIMSDGSQLTLGEDVELMFENLSGSPDGLSDDEGTLLRLLEGEALLRVGLVRTSAYYPVIDTANARIYIQEDGIYRFEANDHDFTEVSVLEGSVEVLTQTDDVVLVSGEAASFDGYADPYVARLRADWDEEIVLWSDNIERRYSRGSSAVLDTPLSGTAHLDESGDWVTVDTGRAWRPRVEATWRPYNRGRWAHTPSGLYWVSHDPWLPVTYRYGLWDLHPTHGWLWHPGYRYRTAHVYWYWGSDYAGWIPSGYYNRYYRHRYSGFGFRAGVLGWAGLRWDPFWDWTFCPTRYIGYRNSYRHYERGRHLYDRGVRLDRGIIATSTRGLGRDDWKRPALVSAALERGWRRNSGNRDLPDVNGLVSRGDLSPEVRDRFVVARERRGGTATGSTASVNRSGRVATTIRDDASVPSSSARGAVSTRSRDAGREGRVVRRTSTPSRVPGTASSSRGAVRRPSTSATARDSASRSSSSARGAAPRRTAGSATRSSSPARRVIEGAGSRGSSTRSGTPSRRAPTAASGSSGSSARSRAATPTRRPPAARSSSGSSSSSRPRASTTPPRRPSSASSSRGGSSTRSSARPPSTRRSTPPPSRSSSASSSRGRSSTRSSSPPPRSRTSTAPPRRSSSSSSSARRSTPPPRSRPSASSSTSARRSSTASSRSNRSAPSSSRTSARSTRPSTSSPRATVQRSRSNGSASRASARPASRRSTASSSRARSSTPRASAGSSRGSSRSSATRSSSSRSSSRSTAARSSSQKKPPGA